MTQETLFEAIGTIDECFLFEVEKVPKKGILWLKIACVAASLALILTGSGILYTYTRPSPSTPEPPFVISDENAFIVSNVPTVPSTEPSTPAVVYPDADKRVIAEIHPSSGNLSCYERGPYPGECWIDIYGPSLEEEIDPNTVYWVEIYLDDENGRIFTGDVIYAEAQRLANLGYEIYLREFYWTGYWGEDKHITHLCGYFTKEHLEQFPSSDCLGYMISYCHDDVADYERVVASPSDTRAYVLYPELAAEETP